jgi:molybdate/tungstate transport system ATP-binding protein
VIEARGLTARAGAFRLVDISFTVPKAAYGVVIGPAGSGKTTLLETIAGINPQTGGVLRLDGRDVITTPPEQRGLGLVYQHGYLFPHLSVEANIAYGASDASEAKDIAIRLGAWDLRDRAVESLSGGERQMVALARALAHRPSILLLDEPFSALDPRRRETTRRELRRIHREWGLTVLQVTHDFTEAGLLGDVAILLDRGKVLQSGRPDEVFRKPASSYVAEFLGAENVFAGTAKLIREDSAPAADGADAAVDARAHQAVEFRTGPLTIYAVASSVESPGYAVIRAEEVLLSLEPQVGSSARNHFAGRITEISTLGALTRVALDVDGAQLVAALTTRSAHELALEVGMEAYASFKAMAVHLC